MIGWGIIVHSQSIKGKLLDLVDNKPLAGATLTLTSLKDSTTKRNSVADSAGIFRFSNLPVDSFFIKVGFIGYDEYRQIVATNDSTALVDLGTLFIPKSSVQLGDVTVTAKTPPTQQKGDTIQYNASQFKVNPDATVEDLVKKAPGVTVDRDGTVTAQGEQVRKVTIDGRDFFGDDASAALRNLPADIVDKIQVFNRLSDQAQLTGVDDGNSVKAINIVTKAGMRNGQFGRLYAGYGTDDRYQAGGNVSFFKENRRISLVGLVNNINQQNFGSQDLLGLTSSGGGGGFGGRGGGGGGARGGGGGGGGFGGGGFGGGQGGFTVGQQNGISRTNALGINYSDSWGKKINVSGSYFFNNSNLNNDQVSNQQNIAKPDSTLFTDDNTTSRTNNYNHRANLRIEYRIDSSNTLFIIPSFSYQKNNSMTKSLSQGYYDKSTGLESQLENDRNNLNSGYTFNNTLLYRHAFAKRGRSISINVNTSFNDRQGDIYQQSLTQYFKRGTSDTVLQFTDNTTNGRTISTNLIYTEPIGKKGQLQLNYNPSFTKNSADKETFKFDQTSKTYSVLDPTLSNIFDNTYNTQNGGITYRLGDRNHQFSVGVNYQHSDLESDQKFPARDGVSRTFSNILPNLQWRTKISTRSSIRLFYRTSVNAPSVNQLQNVIDNTNPLYITAGNPDLKQQYTHTLVGQYTFTNTQLGQSFFANVYLQKTNDYVANAVYTAVLGDSILAPSVVLKKDISQLTKPVNLDGYWSARSFFTFGQPVKAIKTNVNLNGGFSFSQTPVLSNIIKSLTNTYAFNSGIVLASNISEYVDFNLSYSANFNRVRNAKQPVLNSNYISQVSGIQFNLLSKKGWFLQNDLNNQTYSGLAAGYNSSFWLWNAAIGKKFLKNRSGELKLSAFDILKQNQSISRTSSGNTITDERNTVLQRYFMLTFTYSLKNFGKPAARQPRNFQRGGPGNFGPQFF